LQINITISRLIPHKTNPHELTTQERVKMAIFKILLPNVHNLDHIWMT